MEAVDTGAAATGEGEEEHGNTFGAECGNQLTISNVAKNEGMKERIRAVPFFSMLLHLLMCY